MSLREVALTLESTIEKWQSLRGEYAEVLKAEAQARVEGIENSFEATITARRKDGERAALQYTKESLDMKADLDILEQWIAFYSMLINNGIDIPVSEVSL